MKVTEFKEFLSGLDHLTDTQLHYLERLFSEKNQAHQITQAAFNIMFAPYASYFYF